MTNMQNDDLTDRLRRVLEMEERMSAALISLCEPQALPASLPPDTKQTIAGMLLQIRDDTLRHQKFVADLLEKGCADGPQSQ